MTLLKIIANIVKEIGTEVRCFLKKQKEQKKSKREQNREKEQKKRDKEERQKAKLSFIKYQVKKMEQPLKKREMDKENSIWGRSQKDKSQLFSGLKFFMVKKWRMKHQKWRRRERRWKEMMEKKTGAEKRYALKHHHRSDKGTKRAEEAKGSDPD